MLLRNNLFYSILQKTTLKDVILEFIFYALKQVKWFLIIIIKLLFYHIFYKWHVFLTNRIFYFVIYDEDFLEINVIL